MKIKYKIKDGNLEYQVIEYVSNLSFVVKDEVVTHVAIVRRRHFLIADTLVKQDSPPAILLEVNPSEDKVLPTALNLKQVIDAVSVYAIGLLPSLPDATEVELPVLGDDVGQVVYLAKVALAEIETARAIAKEQYDKINVEVVEARAILDDLKSDIKVLQDQHADLERELKSKDHLLTVIDAEAKRTVKESEETVSRLQKVIIDLSEQSTKLQLEKANAS